MKSKSSKKQLHFYYDQEADVLYLSLGKPLETDDSNEIDDGIVARYDAKTKKIKGLTILHAALRTKSGSVPIKLPLEVSFSQ